jgi:hypothetical protein
MSKRKRKLIVDARQTWRELADSLGYAHAFAWLTNFEKAHNVEVVL